MKVKLKSKLGVPFWRFGTQLSPDDWTEFDLTDTQLAAIKAECTLPVSKGGALEIKPDPWAKAKAEPEPAPPAKPESKSHK